MKWNKFTLTTTTQAVDLVSGLLAELGIEEVEIEDNVQISEEDKRKMFIDILPELPEDDKTARVIFYMPDDISEIERKDTLQKIKDGVEELRMFVDAGSGSIEESVTEDKDWVNNWKQYFKPFMVDDIIIKPTWEDIDNRDFKAVVEIDPGTSFGTGRHETTMLCIKQLRRYIKNGMSVLDVGCGSGILSVISRLLGADRIIGIDVDENAVASSIENAKVNKINDINFFAGNIINDKEVQDKTGYECYDIVVANILADVIIPLSSEISAHMRDGALFISSGIINTKEEDVVRAISGNRYLDIKEITEMNDWVCITAVKSGKGKV